MLPPVATPESRADFRRRYIGFPEVIDSTMMASAACPQKFFNEYVLKLSTVGRSPDLHAGGALARAMEEIRMDFYGNGLPIEQALAEGLHAFMEYWGDYEAPESSPKDFVTVWNAVREYFLVAYPPATDHIQPYRADSGSPAVEFTFAIPTEVIHPETGQPILYGGRADMIGQYNGGLLAIVDEKTTKNTPYMPDRMWAMRGQFLGYCFAAQQSGLDCSTAIIRTIVLQKTQYKFLEVIEQYGQWQIDRWWRMTNRKLQKLVYSYERSLEWISAYRETGDSSQLVLAHDDFDFNYGDLCSQFNGCPMLGLCTSEDPSIWYDDYDIRLWDPLRQDPSELSPALPTQEISWEDAVA